MHASRTHRREESERAPAPHLSVAPPGTVRVRRGVGMVLEMEGLCLPGAVGGQNDRVREFRSPRGIESLHPVLLFRSYHCRVAGFEIPQRQRLGRSQPPPRQLSSKAVGSRPIAGGLHPDLCSDWHYDLHDRGRALDRGHQ